MARHARELFLEGTKEEKHTLVNCVASNLFLKDKIVNFELKTPFKILTEVPQSTTVLPLVNAFKNREIEFGFSLQNIQTVFETFKIQTQLAFG